LAGHLYSVDNNDPVANNHGIYEVHAAISNGKLDNWVNNVMDWTTATMNIDKTLVANVRVGAAASWLQTANRMGLFFAPNSPG
jgi:hypothetical protein